MVAWGWLMMPASLITAVELGCGLCEVPEPVVELELPPSCAGPGFVTTKKLPATTLFWRPACRRTVGASKSLRLAAAFWRVPVAWVFSALVSTRIWVYRWLSGVLAGGEGPKYGARAAVLAVFCRRKTDDRPLVVLRVVAEVAGVRPVCIQWSRVPVFPVTFVGMSRSIIMMAYDVPVSWVVVPTCGSFALTEKQGQG